MQNAYHRLFRTHFKHTHTHIQKTKRKKEEEKEATTAIREKEEEDAHNGTFNRYVDYTYICTVVITKDETI